MFKTKSHIACQPTFGCITSIQYTKNGLYFIDNDQLYLAPHNTNISVRLFVESVQSLQVSPNQEWLSFVMHRDIHVYNVHTNELRRITYYENDRIKNLIWDDDHNLFFALRDSSIKLLTTYRINIDSQESSVFLKVDCSNITKSPKSRYIIQDRGYGYSAWRGYKGGSVARLLELDKNGDGHILQMPNNLSQYNCHSPCFVDEKLFFIGTDANGIANIYEYDFGTQNPIQRTFHEDFYVVYITRAENSILYICGSEVYTLSMDQNYAKSEIVDVSHTRFKSQDENTVCIHDIVKFATSCAINDKMSIANMSSRGHVLVSQLWSNSYEKLTDKLRYVHSAFIDDATTLNIRNHFDENALEMITCFETYSCATHEITNTIQCKIGFVKDISNVYHKKIVCLNHIGELYCVDLEQKEHFLICKSMAQHIDHFDVSPDGKWATYSMLGDYARTVASKNSSIYLYSLQTRTQYKITNDYFHNHGPQFSANGKYVTFLSNKDYQAKYDRVYFSMYYNESDKLRAFGMHSSYLNPFNLSQPCADKHDDHDDKHDDHDDHDDKDTKKCDTEGNLNAQKECSDKKAIKALEPDIHNLQNPVFFEYRMKKNEGIICGAKFIKKDQLLLTLFNEKKIRLSILNLESNQFKTIAKDVKLMSLSNNAQNIAVVAENHFKIGKVGDDLMQSDDTFKNGGQISFNAVYADLSDEYRDIFQETWWFAKERFWSQQEIKNLNWTEIYHKYNKRLSQISTRTGLNSLISEMLGELKTSHAYVVNPGDVGEAYCAMGSGDLGITYTRCKNGGYIIDEILRVDAASIFSPLSQYCKKGDIITSINGAKCDSKFPLNMYVSNACMNNICIGYKQDGVDKQCFVKPMTQQQVQYMTYKKWVNDMETYVAEKTNDRVALIHIADMQKFGFNEFHTAYARAQYKDAIIIDLRWNGGGHTSSLIFKLLSNIQTGLGICPDHEYRFPYESHAGKIIFLCNYSTGSDGDVGTYHAKHLGYTVIGTRTWGGVVGIEVRDTVVDGGMYSFPEHALTIHTKDNKIEQIENYGVDPTIHIDNEIRGYKMNDAQLDRAIEEIKKMIN